MGAKPRDLVRGLAGISFLAGGAVLIWPAFVNGYPLLFSDTGAFLVQALSLFMVWDKPWIYGPVLVPMSLLLTLWLPAFAQGLVLSWVLWRVQTVFGPPVAWRHLGLCMGLAVASAAPWFAALLMPDIFAPLTVLLLFVLAFGPNEYRRWPCILLAAFAIAVHLTHLVIAAACIIVLMAMRPAAVPRALAPLALALALLVATNVIGHGRFGVSPFGSVFALARMVADGPAAELLRERCPDPDFRMCAWVGRLPATSDEFLWNPNGPVWTTPGGPIALAEEASRIVQATVLAHPLAVLKAAAANAAEQLVTLRLDEVVSGNWLDQAVGEKLRTHYPAAEAARFGASAQRHDRLRAIAAPWQGPQMVMLALGAAGTVLVLLLFWRRDAPQAGLAALCLAGILANGFATGALSGPHDRYGARMGWLLILVPAIWLVVHSPRRTRGDDV